MERTVFMYPKGEVTPENENQVKKNMIMEFTNMKNNQFKKIRDFKCKFVTRKYAFEMEIPHGQHKFLKIKYPSTDPPLPATLRGDTFECIFGAN